MPNGFTGSRQLRAIADLCRRLGNCVLDITTRQQIQLRGFALPSLPEIWEKLHGVDLHSLQTGMDNVRNINGCPLAGLTINELFDASLVLLELDRMIVSSDGNPDFTNLPRKFNVVVTGCLENCTHSESQDLALVPAMRRDRAGFNVLVGGDGHVGNGQRSGVPAGAAAFLPARWHPHRACRGCGRTWRFPSPLDPGRGERSDGTVQPRIVPFRNGISSSGFRVAPVGYRVAYHVELAVGGTCRHFLLSLVRQKLGQQRKLIPSLGPK